MAEEQDDSQKTEDPTEKKLQDAREKGQIPSSREVNNFFLLGTATLLTATLALSAAGELGSLLSAFITRPHELLVDRANVGHALLATVLGTLKIMVLPFLAFMVAAVAAVAVQNGIVLTGETAKPKFERVSPMAGAKRLFSMKSAVEFLKSLFKITLVAVVGIAVLWPERSRFIESGQLEIGPLVDYLHQMTLLVLASVSGVALLLAGFDFAYQKFEFTKQMRMSKRDVKDEHKQSDGDPMVKQRLRGLRMEKARQRMMSDVPKSTVVITNPTHYSIALRYDPKDASVPIVVAKGADRIALKIREVAADHGVPVMESPPLARTLYASVGVGEMVPVEQFQAVAEIIGHVLRLRNQ